MKIDYHYPELELWVTLWAEKPDRFDGLWWDRKQKLKEDIRLAATDALRPGGVSDSAGDAAKEAEPARMPDGEDGHVGE